MGVGISATLLPKLVLAFVSGRCIFLQQSQVSFIVVDIFCMIKRLCNTIRKKVIFDKQKTLWQMQLDKRSTHLIYILNPNVDWLSYEDRLKSINLQREVLELSKKYPLPNFDYCED